MKTLVGCLVCLVWTTWVYASVATEPGDACYRLTLQKAVGAGSSEGRDLQVSLDIRGGKVVGAFGNAPRFNKMPAELDAKGVAVVDGKLTGTLKVTIAWDGWAPTNGNSFSAEYGLDARVVNGHVDGKWTLAGSAPAEGAVTGASAARASDAELIRLTLACVNAIDHNRKIGARGLHAVIVLKDGKAVSVRAIPAGSIADVGCSMETPKFDLALVDGKLTGTFQVRVTPQGVSEQNPVCVYTYQIQGVVVGDGAGGAMTVAKDGAALKEVAAFIATVRTGPPPRMEDCSYKLTLHHALGLGQFIDLYLATTGGKLTGGFASSPNFNNAMHVVDVSRLQVGDGKISGDLGVTVLADPWIPADHKPIACAFTVDATVANGEIIGRFKGKAGEKPVEEAVVGALEDKVKLDPVVGMTIRLENGLAGSGNHMARAFVTMDIKEGKVTGGGVWNNHDKGMKGAVTGGEFKLNGDEWRLKVEFTLAQAGRATPGKYVATASGTFVGIMSAGQFTCTHEAGRMKEGGFWASLKLGPVAEQ